jgi:hypothetical protein
MYTKDKKKGGKDKPPSPMPDLPPQPLPGDEFALVRVTAHHPCMCRLLNKFIAMSSSM